MCVSNLLDEIVQVNKASKVDFGMLSNFNSFFRDWRHSLMQRSITAVTVYTRTCGSDIQYNMSAVVTVWPHKYNVHHIGRGFRIFSQ